jgi:hypothetical protein
MFEINLPDLSDVPTKEIVQSIKEFKISIEYADELPDYVKEYAEKNSVHSHIQILIKHYKEELKRRIREGLEKGRKDD